MKSRLTLGLDANMVPVIKFSVAKKSDDLRDDVAKRFADGIGFKSNLCTIVCINGNDINAEEKIYEIRSIGDQEEIPDGIALAGLIRTDRKEPIKSDM